MGVNLVCLHCEGVNGVDDLRGAVGEGKGEVVVVVICRGVLKCCPIITIDNSERWSKKFVGRRLKDSM